MPSFAAIACLLALTALCWASPAPAQERFITVASTTSTEQSSLFGHILPRFAAASGIQVRIVALGTGQALDLARRGDRSGTHAAELCLWQAAGIDIARDKGPWYRETGQGMGPALNTAAAMGAYILSDRGTWLSFGNRQDMGIAVEGDRRLFNQYGIMLVNPARHPHVKKELGRAFVDWITSREGQRAIADYRIGGEQLFFPNAGSERART